MPVERKSAEDRLLRQLQDAMETPPPQDALAQSRRRVWNWFAGTAPLLAWSAMESPLGVLYVAASSQGLYSLDFGVGQEDFLNSLDPLARTERNPSSLLPFLEQLEEYFGGARYRFELPVDLNRLTPFQRTVLSAARTIPAGQVWTYKQVAAAIDKPQASRAVGQALGRNPVPIVIPCHRVIASDGSLGGYSGGGGLASKALLLRLEKALDVHPT